MTDRAGRGVVASLVLVGALVAFDASGANAHISGSYVLGAFFCALVADARWTTIVGAVALILSLASPLWNHNFGSVDWASKLVVVIAGDLFAIEMARLRLRLMRSVRDHRALAAIAGLPEPGASPAETVARVTELLVPRVTPFAAVDAERGGERVRMGERGSAPIGSNAIVETSLQARGREIGTLAIGAAGRHSERDREFLAVLAGRVALALDNAGLSLELFTAEQRFEAILANLAEAITVQDPTGRIVFANRTAAELLGAASVEELLATPPIEFVERFETYNEDGTPMRLDQLPGRHVLAGKAAEPLVVRAVHRVTREERWRVTKSTPVYGADGEVALAVNIIEDITEAKRAELSQRLLADASSVLASSLDYEYTLQRVAELAVPELADWCAVSVQRGPLLEPVAVAHADAVKRDEARRDSERFRVRVDSDDITAEVFRSRRSQLIADPAMLVVPLTAGDRTFGVVVLVATESRKRFTAGDVALAEELARRAAIALENARLHTEIEDVAQTLQRSLLPPRLPAVPGWSFQSLYMPAVGQTDVGGDFYDVFPTAAGWMAVIGDVAGRGAAAASLTAMARYTLRTAGSLVGTPTMALARLNDNLRERGEMALCTAALVLLRDGADEASVVCAGHPLPYLIRAGRPQPVGRTGPLLGAFEHGHWLPAAVRLERGDVLVLFTDGVLDAPSANGRRERFGEERLAQALTGTRDDADAVARIRTALAEFAGGQHSDDTAVLTLMRT